MSSTELDFKSQFDKGAELQGQVFLACTEAGRSGSFVTANHIIHCARIREEDVFTQSEVGLSPSHDNAPEVEKTHNGLNPFS